MNKTLWHLRKPDIGWYRVDVNRHTHYRQYATRYTMAEVSTILSQTPPNTYHLRCAGYTYDYEGRYDSRRGTLRPIYQRYVSPKLSDFSGVQDTGSSPPVQEAPSGCLDLPLRHIRITQCIMGDDS